MGRHRSFASVSLASLAILGELLICVNAKPIVWGNMTLADENRNFFEYVTMIAFSTFVATLSAVCGVCICIFCKYVPKVELSWDSESCPCEFMLRGCCCPDPIPEFTKEELELKKREARIEQLKKDYDDEEEGML